MRALLKDLIGNLHSKHRVLFWFAAFGSSFFLLGALFYGYVAFFLPLPDIFYQPPPAATTKIYDRHGELLYEILNPEEGKKTFVQLEQFPGYFLQATLAAEDIAYYEHGGVNLWAILRAIFFNVREQRIVSGASTITQQLVRNMIGMQQRARGIDDKILEALYAIRLNHVYTKNQALELYLNTIYYGNLAYGAQSAALDYFDKKVADLDLAQSSFLAGLPQSPSSYNPFLYFDRAKKRQKYVLDQMVKYHFISREEADGAFAQPLHLRRNVVQMKAPHFVHYVINQLSTQLGEQAVREGGLSIYTTLDYNFQRIAEEVVSRQVSLLQDKQVTNGALLAMDPKTSQILAWVGSENYFDESIDGAVDIITSLRQPGSALKPFTYLAAFEQDYTPATILEDIPTEFTTDQGPYSPKNYDLRYHGPVRARNALASSFNIPAVKTLDHVGLGNFLHFLQKLGFDSFDQDPEFYGLALTLGGGEVRMLDLARAYNVLANRGYQQEIGAILAIRKQGGESLHEWKSSAASFLLGPHGQEHIYQIIDILKDPLARLGGFGEGSVLELSREAAVKTGTTRNFRDNWTVGFTPNLLTAVWVGNADGSPMFNISGIDGAGPIWHDFMEAALTALPEEHFAVPPRLHQIEICAISGKLPTEYCSERVFEWFIRGEEPREYDDYYQLCDGKVAIVYPPTLQKWAHGEGHELPLPGSCRLHPLASKAVESEKPPAITIDTPNNGDEYMLEGSLPPGDQKIPFRVTVPLETQAVHFYVDGKLVGTEDALPFTHLWMPVRGEHSLQVEASLQNGLKLKSEKVRFRIL